jgi:hypothetical protein
LLDKNTNFGYVFENIRMCKAGIFSLDAGGVKVVGASGQRGSVF